MKRCLIIFIDLLLGFSALATTRPTGYGAVPGYRPVAYGNGVDLAQSCVFLGREVDVTGYHHFGERDFDPVSGQWLERDRHLNDRDPNGQTYCGGDPIDNNDSDGSLSAQNYNSNPSQGLGADNGVPSLTFTMTTQSSQNQNVPGLSYETTSQTVGTLGLSQSVVQFGSGAVTVGDNGTIYTSGWSGNQYVSTSKIANIADKVALPLAFISVGVDTIGVVNGDITPTKWTVNTGFTGIGFVAPPFGAITAGEYFLIDTTYPGGWPGYLHDSRPAAAALANSIFTVPGF